MRAVVLGVGRMGTAIAWAMDKLGFHVIGMDTNPKAADNIPRKINHEQSKDENGNSVFGPPNNEFFLVKDAEDICKGLEAQVKPDVVISSLPYHQTEIVGKWCIDHGVRYCDLGGRVDVSQNINEHANQKGRKPVFTDLGLAPGLVNILAEEAKYETRGAKRIEMFVGGLPQFMDPLNPLKYECTWSIDGLINEYEDDCIVLENGQEKVVKGMEGYQLVDFEGEDLEAFYTSGGASHTINTMKNAGVENCSYKTLRYLGHRDIVRFLIRKSGLSSSELAKLFINGCPETGHGDRVLIHVNAENGPLKWKQYIEVLSDDKFSAMQKATAFPISCVASLMAEGKLEGNKEQHRDYWTKYPKALTYADVPHAVFKKRLLTLGLEL
mgnify:CR=1 FL=1